MREQIPASSALYGQSRTHIRPAYREHSTRMTPSTSPRKCNIIPREIPPTRSLEPVTDAHGIERLRPWPVARSVRRGNRRRLCPIRCPTRLRSRIMGRSRSLSRLLETLQIQGDALRTHLLIIRQHEPAILRERHGSEVRMAPSVAVRTHCLKPPPGRTEVLLTGLQGDCRLLLSHRRALLSNRLPIRRRTHQTREHSNNNQPSHNKGARK